MVLVYAVGTFCVVVLWLENRRSKVDRVLCCVTPRNAARLRTVPVLSFPAPAHCVPSYKCAYHARRLSPIQPLPAAEGNHSLRSFSKRACLIRVFRQLGPCFSLFHAAKHSVLVC